MAYPVDSQRRPADEFFIFQDLSGRFQPLVVLVIEATGEVGFNIHMAIEAQVVA